MENYDHGPQVAVFRPESPAGWRVDQPVATDLNDVWRMYFSCVVDFFGPDGEVVTHLSPVAVYPAMGQSWEDVWLELFHERVGRLGRFDLGPTARSAFRGSRISPLGRR